MLCVPARMTDSQRPRRIEWDPRDYSTQDRVNLCTELREQIQSGQFNQIEVFSYHECAGEARRGLNGEPEFDTAPLAWLLYNPHFRRVQFFPNRRLSLMGKDGTGIAPAGATTLNGRARSLSRLDALVVESRFGSNFLLGGKPLQMSATHVEQFGCMNMMDSQVHIRPMYSHWGIHCDSIHMHT